MLNPRYPAAVESGNDETSTCITDALYGALGVMAASQGTMNNFTFGNQRYQYYETISGGSGGAGQWHGGNGGGRKLRFLEPRTASILSNCRLHAPFGMAGGEEGAKGRNLVIRCDGAVEELPHVARTDMQAGDG